MKHTPLPANFYKQNRKRLASHLKPKSIVIIGSNDLMPTNADGVFPFFQNTDFLFLTGIEQEDSLFIFFPDHPNKAYRNLLFLKQPNRKTKTWEGSKLDQKTARARSGIQNIRWLHENRALVRQLVCQADHIYLTTNEHLRAVPTTPTANDKLISDIQRQFPLHNYHRLAPILHLLRAVKQKPEIKALNEAITITKQAFEKVLKTLKVGQWEYEVEALIMYEFLKRRSQVPGYQMIVASGSNACVLHYLDNNCRCRAGDLLLLDFGARYANYNADITRVVPINGKFTERQKAVYQAVLSVQKEAIALLKVGNNLHDYHKEVGKIMESELVKLKLLTKNEIRKQSKNKPLYKKYFMHGTSHHLGLDVHDYGQNNYRIFEKGMIFTCEPGIYIPKEEIGIRLEDDILITEESNLNLSQNIPIEIAEIEDLMARR